MSETVSPAGSERSKPYWTCFGLLVAAGLALRVVAADYSIAIAHPDEHQQYLEQAPPLAWNGPATRFWEQDRGLRNLFYPYCLAGFLLVFESVGIRDPLTQAALLRGLLATAIFLTVAGQAWLEKRRGASACALAMLGLAALMSSAIYVNVRLLSENAMTIPMLLGLMFLQRRPCLAGVCFGVMFAIRFQSAFLIAGVGLLTIYDDVRLGTWKTPRQSRTAPLSAGFLATTFLAVGVLDRITLGAWFQSPWEYFAANIVEGLAASFGVEPWRYYLTSYGPLLMRMSLLAPVVLGLGAVKEWRVAFLMAAMVAGHSVIAHKEDRFLWCLLPLLLLLFARGFESIWNGLPNVHIRNAATALVVLSFGVGSVQQVRSIYWRSEPYRSTSLALADLSRRTDVRGVGIEAVREQCGNFFYLRQDVAILYKSPQELAQMVREGDTVNYFVLERGWTERFDPQALEIVAEYPRLVTCRLKGARPSGDGAGRAPHFIPTSFSALAPVPGNE